MAARARAGEEESRGGCRLYIIIYAAERWQDDIVRRNEANPLRGVAGPGEAVGGRLVALAGVDAVHELLRALDVARAAPSELRLSVDGERGRKGLAGMSCMEVKTALKVVGRGERRAGC